MNKIDLAIRAYKAASEKEIASRNVEGKFLEDDYQTLKEQLEKHGLLIDSNDNRLKLTFSLPHDSNGFFALNLNEILESNKRLLSPPTCFYLADKDYLFQNISDSTPNDVRNYLDTARLVSTLYQLADHVIDINLKAIFLHGEKLELSLRYEQSDLKPLPELEKFIVDFIAAEIHKEQKVTIIKSVLLEMLKSKEINSFTLPGLIGNFSDFVERTYANYELYVSEFSFEKIKNQIETEKFEFTLKLNKVFADIQNQLLAVPVALILVGSQMKVAENYTSQNISIWISSLVFGFFMSLLIRNQSSTLKAIKLEFDSQWNTIKLKHKLVSDKLSCHYEQIKRKYLFQKMALTAVSFIIACSVIASTALLLYSSKQISMFGEVIEKGAVGGIIYILICVFWSEMKKAARYILNFIKIQ